jgi:hypothetical protein
MFISGDQSSLFTGILPHGYGAPPGGFCFDMNCKDDPIMVSKVFVRFFLHLGTIEKELKAISISFYPKSTLKQIAISSKKYFFNKKNEQLLQGNRRVSD